MEKRKFLLLLGIESRPSSPYRIVDSGRFIPTFQKKLLHIFGVGAVLSRR
jgi:hypothetical protein